MSDGSARILDRGFRHYDGERLGLRRALRSVAVQSIQRMLGLRRTIWAKLVPVITAFLAYVPAIVFVGLAIMIPEEMRGDPDAGQYAGYYAYITAVLLLFVAFVGPEVLCPDRRNGMLGLYLASPLSRDTYLVAKGVAVSLVLSIVTIGPPLLLLVGNTISGNGPDGPAEFVGILARILVVGTVIAALYAALALAVSAIANRRAAASATIIVLVFASAIVTEAIVDAGGSDYIGLANLLVLPFELVLRIYSEGLEDDRIMREVPTWAVVGSYLAWTLAFVAVIRTRYQRLDVTR